VNRLLATLAIVLVVAVWLGPAAVAQTDPSPAPPTGQGVPITVENTASPVPVATDHGPLASTGSDIVGQLSLAFGLLVAGLLAIAVTRRTGVSR
jgi:hypothetical protein